MFAEWSDDLSVGVKEIDGQHRFEVELLNKLHDAEGPDVVTVFNELAEHTVMHFRTEEKYFDKFGYKNSDVHKKVHAKFLEKATALGKDLQAGKELTEDTMVMIRDWLVNHIKFMDKKYTKCFNENGLS